MANCRIFPTPNGYPHLGQLYLAKLNQYHARSTGGTLSLLFDDTQPCWLDNPGAAAMAEYAQGWFDDMAWAGITFDKVLYQSKEREAFKRWLSKHNYHDNAEHHDYLHAPIRSDGGTIYPWEDWLTIEKVYMDACAGIDLVIRGIDLLAEYALYQHMWNEYVSIESNGDVPPEHVYIPRLIAGVHEGQIDNVSKTNGTYKLRTFREKGVTPEQLDTMLRYACLEYVHGDWDWHNLKARPMLTTESPLFHYTRNSTAEFVRG